MASPVAVFYLVCALTCMVGAFLLGWPVFTPLGVGFGVCAVVFQVGGVGVVGDGHPDAPTARELEDS